jgi:hypothetical protein
MYEVSCAWSVRAQYVNVVGDDSADRAGIERAVATWVRSPYNVHTWRRK